MRQRALFSTICEDLREKMVFLSGPRQVGKTTLAQQVLAAEGPGAYYTWDNRHDRRVVLQAEWPPPPALLVLDEFHKYRFWKRWLKGEYDKHRRTYRFLVTGSARLDTYRKGGDSLQGRYHPLRLHPFSLGELVTCRSRAVPFEPLPIENAHHGDACGLLLERGGFPEPLFAATTRAQRRWQKQRLDRFFREDVRDLSLVRDLSSMELLADLLPGRVGSPLSLNSLREDLEVTHRAVSHWVDVLERLYFVFRLSPFATRAVRALHKEKKVYLWDWSLVEDVGARFENFIASHLLKLCHRLEDEEGYAAQLHYVRDTAKHEVDFLVTVRNKPWMLVEAKWKNDQVAPALRYFGERLHVPLLYQVVGAPNIDKLHQGVRVISADRFLASVA